MIDISYFQIRAILAPKNPVVEEINDYILDLLSGEEKFHLSYDSPYSRNINGDVVVDVHTPEFLNTITASGLSNHTHIKSRSLSDVVKEYRSNIKIMQWNKTHYNQNGHIRS